MGSAGTGEYRGWVQVRLEKIEDRYSTARTGE